MGSLKIVDILKLVLRVGGGAVICAKVCTLYIVDLKNNNSLFIYTILI